MFARGRGGNLERSVSNKSREDSQDKAAAILVISIRKNITPR